MNKNEDAKMNKKKKGPRCRAKKKKSSSKMVAERRSQMGSPKNASRTSVVSSLVDRWRRATGSRGAMPTTDAEVREAMVNASKRGQTDAMKDLMNSRDVDVDAPNALGARPLTSAVRYARDSAAQMLLDAGADVNARDERSGTSALHWAAFKGHTKCVDVLLKAGADVNVQDSDGSTPLHDAALRGHAKVVAMLLAAGAQPDPQKSSGETPADLTKSKKIRDMLQNGVRRSRLDSNIRDSNDALLGKTSTLPEISDRLLRFSRPTRPSVMEETPDMFDGSLLDDLETSSYSLPSQPTEHSPVSGFPEPKKTVSVSDADQYFPPRSKTAPNLFSPTQGPVGQYPYVNPQYIPPYRTCRPPDSPAGIKGEPLGPPCYQPQYPISGQQQYGDPARETSKMFPRPQSPAVPTNESYMPTYPKRCSFQCPGILDPSPEYDIFSSCLESRLTARTETTQSQRQSLALGEIVKAANSGREDLVHEVIRNRGMVDEEDIRNELHFALHRAARQGLPVAVKTLIRCGALVNARDKGRMTPLHWAAANDNSQITYELLAAGAHPTTTDEYGLTPLHQAAASGNAANVKLLLQAGADPLAQDIYGISPIDAAIGEANDVLRQHFDQANTIARVILEATYEGNAAQVARLLAEGVPVNITDAKGYSPLHVAALAGHLEMVRLLLDHGADVNMIALDGTTPFELAFTHGHISVANLLLERGASMPLLDPTKQSPKVAMNAPAAFTTDPWICSRPNECVNSENPYQPDGFPIQTDMSKAPNPSRGLFFAAKTGNVDKLLEILNSGKVNVDEKFSQTTTALHVAARYGYKEVLNVLLERDANPDIKDRYGERPLHWASAFGHVDCVHTLIMFGAQVNARDNEGRTPLHDAVLANQADSARALLDAGADRSLRDSDGKTPLEYVETDKMKSILLDSSQFSPLKGEHSFHS